MHRRREDLPEAGLILVAILIAWALAAAAAFIWLYPNKEIPMSWLNLNAFHNAINLVLGVIGAIMAFDWTLLGLTPQQMGSIISICMLIKLVANAARDGLAGMVKQQPPVADQVKTLTIATTGKQTDVSVSTPGGGTVDLKPQPTKGL